ncbi:MAG: Ig-like domain-containing protein, partial [Methanobrevibacter sp.]|nr:Ig-like domain-containing protein [Methanobrevibacter sp.]
GYPSKIGDINITGNTINVIDADASKVTFVEILSNSGPLSPYAPIAITDNTIAEGARLVKVTYANWADLPSSINGESFSGGVDIWYDAWNADNGVIIPASEKTATAIQIVAMDTSAGTITIKLIDAFGVPMDKEEIAYTIAGGEEQYGVTEDGLLTINVDKNGLVSFAFAETNKYKGSTAEMNFAFSKKITKLTAAAKTYLITATTKSISATLKDENGVALAGKKVTFTVNNKTYTATTNANGVATVKVSLSTAKAYAVSVKYAGEDKYGAASVSSKITVNKVATKATVPVKKFKKAATSKKVTFTLKTSAGKAIAKKKVTFTVNGKTYSAYTNSKGVATVNLKITKKGTYYMTSKFAGDKTYKAVSKKTKVYII